MFFKIRRRSDQNPGFQLEWHPCMALKKGIQDFIAYMVDGAWDVSSIMARLSGSILKIARRDLTK